THSDLVEEACDRAGVRPHLVILEPAGRNTAPACVAGALSADPGDVLVILPSDHLIADTESFRATVDEAARHAEQGSIVAFGITPDRPETGFGYIRAGEKRSGGWSVAEFVEKPELARAEQMVEQAGYLWNSGMFVLTAETLLAETRRVAPSLVAGVEGAMRPGSDGWMELGPEFAEVESVSFDHAVMEKTDRGVVFPLEAGWDDIGSFQALWAASDRDEHGNTVEGDVVLRDVEGSLIRATSRRVAAAGLDGVVIIETPDAVLVVPRSRAQLVRELATGDG
ncbi:MAG: mannose-1-phosphate guanylyltransferase/mannose-6-phosphate isomerase, partial [Actinobacteria bacterium]|nr:mannose-1-phosphate guanylyltransferase/mannose-6-phosphate isomerase [Actinomycetota bacterium]